MRWTPREDLCLALDDATDAERDAALGAVAALGDADETSHTAGLLRAGLEVGQLQGATLAELAGWCHDQRDPSPVREAAREASKALLGFVVPTEAGATTSDFFWRVARRLH